jgi:hypothetical protein
MCGFAAAAVYVVGDIVSGFAYKSARPYSFKDQWISELTARGSPVRPGMVTVVTIHDLLLIAFGIGVWRAGADAQNRSLRWAGVTTALSSVAIQGIEENDTPWAGALERVSAYGFMVWLVVLAFGLRVHGLVGCARLGHAAPL